ncbi:MAG TPA: hypothetical protein VNN73_21110 [Blastocatellia bacterium]|nr:hypothetical protein [Blastocatellia bacterium]
MSAAGMCTSTGTKTESRSYLRARCEVNGLGRDCRILNLSSRKAFVESFVPAITGSKVSLQFRLPNGYVVCTTGVVSNHEFKVGFGVDFTGMSAADFDQLHNFVG